MGNITQLSINLKDPTAVQQALNAMYRGQEIKWRDCRRKAYSIYACKLPTGYVYANKLEQSESYNAIMKQFKKPIVPKSQIEKTEGAAKFLEEHGYYVTSKERITICGTQGEMLEVKLEDFVSSYRLADNSVINPDTIQVGKWFVVNSVGQNVATEIGIQIPSNFFVQLLTISERIVYMNNPKSKGHFKGDVLVFPKGANGKPDFTKSASYINNAVFALTFDQTTGGWGKSGCVIPAEKAQSDAPTIEQLNAYTDGIRCGSELKPVNIIPDNIYQALLVKGKSFHISGQAFIDKLQSMPNENNSDSFSLVTYKKCLEDLMLLSFKANVPEVSTVSANFYRDYIGTLASIDLEDNSGSDMPLRRLAAYLVSSALTLAMSKYIQTKEIIGALKTAHSLGLLSYTPLFDINTSVSFHHAYSINNRIYYPFMTKITSLFGCRVKSTRDKDDNLGHHLIALIIDKNKSEVSVALTPALPNYDYSTCESVMASDFDKVAVSISHGGESFDDVVNKLAKALMSVKGVWGKSIKYDTVDIASRVYATFAYRMRSFYAHLLTEDAFTDLEIVQAACEGGKEEIKNGFTVPLVFNISKYNYDNIIDNANGDATDVSDLITDRDIEGKTRVLRVKYNAENSEINFKVQFEGKLFDKSYKLTVKNNVEAILLQAYMNMCNILHVHPAKTFFSSMKIWNSFLLPETVAFLRYKFNDNNVPVLKCKGIKTKDYYVYINLGIFTQDGTREIGTRVLRVELNYHYFDVKNESNANRARELSHDTHTYLGVEHALKRMSIRLAIQNMKSSRSNGGEDFVRFDDIIYVLSCELSPLLHELVNNTKKYSVIKG